MKSFPRVLFTTWLEILHRYGEGGKTDFFKLTARKLDMEFAWLSVFAFTSSTLESGSGILDSGLGWSSCCCVIPFVVRVCGFYST